METETDTSIATDDPIVHIRRQWNEGSDATVKLSQIGGLHWSDVSGGVMASAGRDFLHGYVWCTEVVVCRRPVAGA